MKEKNILLDKFSFSSAGLFLFLVLLFIRLPFFFRDYIDRDESTFILMGQSIADGYLPYDRLWDLKPPLLFYIFGLIEYVFPYSLIAVRFFGVMIIFSSAVFLLQIARATGLKNGFWIALSYILLSSMFGSVQGVMSEHVAVFFMLAGLLLFVKKKNISCFGGLTETFKLNKRHNLSGFYRFITCKRYPQTIYCIFDVGA